MVRFLALTLALCLAKSATIVHASEYVFGSDFLNAGTVFGPSPLANCILPPKVVEGNFTSPIGELQNSLNFTLLNTIIDPSFNEANLPPTDEMAPWINIRGNIFTPPGMGGKCFNRSVIYYPKTCVPSAENNNCFEYLDLFNSSWFVVGSGVCLGSYPDSGKITLEQSIPPPGNVGVTLSNQCGQSNFGPNPQKNETSTLMATLVDTYGNRYALQSMLKSFNDTKEWEAYLKSAVLPPGWKQEMVNLTKMEAHYPYIIGNNCFIMLALDNLGNQYHVYDYATPLDKGILSKTNCTVMNNPKGVDGLQPVGPASAPTSGPSPSPVPSSAVRAVISSAITVAATAFFVLAFFN